MYNSFSRVFSCGFPFRLAKENRFVQIGKSLKNQFYWPASHTLETLSGSGVVANSPWNVSIDRPPVKNITTTTNDRQRHKRQNETSCRDFRYFQLDTELHRNADMQIMFNDTEKKPTNYYPWIFLESSPFNQSIESIIVKVKK